MKRFAIGALGLAGIVRLALVPAAFGADETGRAAYQFLNLGTGARLEALGGVGATLGEGADALDWNPARLSGISAPSASAAWFNWLSDVQGGTAAAAIPLGNGRAVGISARSLGVGEFVNNEAEASVSQSDVAVGLGAASPILERLHGGAGLKLVRSSLAGEHGTGWAVDAGLDYRLVRGWDVVAALRNAGPAFGYGDGAKDRLPTQARFGVGGTVSRLRVGLEETWESGPGVGGVAGVEWKLLDRLALRAGSRLAKGSDSAVEPWAVGLGFEARPGLSVDYSFHDGQLDASHRVGLRWTPGTAAKPAAVAPVRSPREFFVDALNRALEKGLAGIPGESGDSILVRAAKGNDATEVVSETLAGRLRERGFRVGVLAPTPVLRDSATAEEKKAFEALPKTPPAGVPLVEFEAKTSTYEILSSSRERWIGPKTVQRRSEVNVALTRRSPGEATPSWTSAGSDSVLETVEQSRIPSSAGFPQPPAAEARHVSPLMEPALVTGIVAGLAIIFFSNRNVGG
ncbi:MAG: PorV/PorQ family protein [bacterium]